MPYSPDHKARTRKRIVETARVLFNREGFSEVSIDRLMNAVGLTRGGFYHHFRSKDELYAEAVASFLNDRGKTWRDDAGIDPENGGHETVRAMIESYLSSEHLGDLDGQCPMIALPSDVARASDGVRSAYTNLLRAMVWLFEHNGQESDDSMERALALSAMCVGGMILARTEDDAVLSDQIRAAARSYALSAVDGDAVQC